MGEQRERRGERNGQETKTIYGRTDKQRKMQVNKNNQHRNITKTHQNGNVTKTRQNGNVTKTTQNGNVTKTSQNGNVTKKHKMVTLLKRRW